LIIIALKFNLKQGFLSKKFFFCLAERIFITNIVSLSS